MSVLPEQELVEALARIEELEALVQSFDAVDKARQAELAFMTSERDYLLGSVDPKLTALREALRWTIESIDITDWSRDGIEMLDSARQLYLDTREGGE